MGENGKRGRLPPDIILKPEMPSSRPAPRHNRENEGTRPLFQAKVISEAIIDGKSDQPVIEVIRDPVGEFNSLSEQYAREERIANRQLEEKENELRARYAAFTPQQRVDAFADLYDTFSGSYDKHMGEDTNHYAAIRKVLSYSIPYLRFPMLDITAGTGEPVKYALEFMAMSRALNMIVNCDKTPERLKTLLGKNDLLFELYRSEEDRAEIPGMLAEHMSNMMREMMPRDFTMDLPEGRMPWVTVNEISPSMLARAREKLAHFGRIEFISHSAIRIGEDRYKLPETFERMFKTVLCSQTFHIMPDLEKIALAKAMYWSLEPGGIAVVMEEDPFYITATSAIDSVALRIRAIASPIENKSDLIGLFKVTGFKKMETRAVSPIDKYHSMRLHMFYKPQNTETENSMPPPGDARSSTVPL